MWEQRQEYNTNVDYKKVLNKLASIIAEEAGVYPTYKDYYSVSRNGSGLTWSESTLLYNFVVNKTKGEKKYTRKQLARKLDDLGIFFTKNRYSIRVHPTYDNILLSGEHTYG